MIFCHVITRDAVHLFPYQNHQNKIVSVHLDLQDLPGAPGPPGVPGTGASTIYLASDDSLPNNHFFGLGTDDAESYKNKCSYSTNNNHYRVRFQYP